MALGNGGEWLILQSASDPLALVGAAAAKRAPGAHVIATDDCPGIKAGLYVLATRPGAARPAGAYVRRCTPRPHSVAALGLPVVDPSFATMRNPPVNFDGSDIVTRQRAGLLLRPYYVAAPNDPREGLRMAVDDVAGRRRPIERDCTDPEVARQGDRIAIACAVEQAAGQYIYRTTVYRARDLARMQAVPRCRNPRFVDSALMRCDAQRIAPDGTVTIAPRDVWL
ncbi:hypothetical protein ACFQ15_11925 [Sphingomonas hankookensis]|uniref:hypothetical protein n=1 Tax=Sphingomonas hankookensis TaxID=563996 RepID=UPI001F55E4E2|nr:hypothetical protein [Sphingomonas hankookensis]